MKPCSFDEVQTGVAASGKFWCHEHFGPQARPDIVAFGKKMQVCGIIAGPRLDEVENHCFRVPSRINSTWGGNLVDMVRAGRILEVIEQDHLTQAAARIGDALLGALGEASQRFPSLVGNVRGRGLLCAFDLPDTAHRNRLISEGLKRDVMFLGCGPRSIRFRPALILSEADIEAGMAVMHEVLGEME